MSSGERPVIKISAKPATGGGPPISLIAYWRQANGMLGGRLDRRITEVAVRMEDGEIIRITKGGDGKWSHYLNAYEEKAEAPRAGSLGGTTRGRRSDLAGGGEDFGGDNIPF